MFTDLSINTGYSIYVKYGKIFQKCVQDFLDKRQLPDRHYVRTRPGGKVL